MEKQSSAARTEWPGLPAGSEEHWRVFGEANARLVRGMLTVWQHELELGQELMTENFADPGVITEFFSGNKDFMAHWSDAHRRFDRTVQAMRRINDEFYDCLFDVAAMASGNGNGNGNGHSEESKPGLAVAAGAREPRATRSN